MEKINDKICFVSIAACCCTILYSIPENSIFSQIVILLSAVCIVFLVVEKQKRKIWCSIIIAVSILKMIPYFPNYSSIIQEIPMIAAMLLLLTKQSKNGARAVIGITGAALIYAVIIFIIYDVSIVMSYLSTGIGSSEIIYFARKFIFEWASEIFVCYIYPVMVSLLSLKIINQNLNTT